MQHAIIAINTVAQKLAGLASFCRERFKLV